MKCLASFLVVFSLFALAGAARAQTVAVPFDFSQSEIGVDVTVNGAHLYILLDTGVDPSVIDLHRAEALRLKIDRKGAGELSGFGNDKGAAAFPTFIQGLAIAGHKFAGFDALTGDMSALSEHYGRRVDAFIGYSFLKDKIILIDYLQHNVYLLDDAAAASAVAGACGTKWNAPMQFLEGENWPLIPQLRLGDAVISATLDTGSSGSITLYESALEKSGVRTPRWQKSEVRSGGFQGDTKLNEYVFNKPAGYGRFELPPGETVTVRKGQASSASVLANVGNKLLADMRLKMMLDYRHKQMTFFGDCH